MRVGVAIAAMALLGVVAVVMAELAQAPAAAKERAAVAPRVPTVEDAVAPCPGTTPSITGSAITIVKSADITSYEAPGTVITYTYCITNTGDSILAAVTVTDNRLPSSAIHCGGTPSDVVALLNPGKSQTCTATYTTTQADVDAGGINNTGTATGTPVVIPPVPDVTDSSNVTIPATWNPTVSIVQSADITSYEAPGTLITYTYDVTNTGNLTLYNVAVTDNKLPPSAIHCGGLTTGNTVASLAVGTSRTCTANYTTTQADVDGGGITNIGTATDVIITPEILPEVTDSSAPVTASSTLTIPAIQNPSVTIVKSADITSYDVPATMVSYTYDVTDTGNVTLYNVAVTDNKLMPSAIHCGGPTSDNVVTSLAVGASAACTATYSTTQADLDAGGITNTGTATGAPVVTKSCRLTIDEVSNLSYSPAGPPLGGRDKPSVQFLSVLRSNPLCPIPENTKGPAIAIVKTALPTGFSGVGEAIHYTYDVTNTGGTTLSDVTVTDDKLAPSAINCGSGTNVVGSLAAGASATCTATYLTTTADEVSKSITNIGTVTGSYATVTHSSTLTIPAVQSPSVTIVKSANTSSFGRPGRAIAYRYAVTNTGNVTLSNVRVTDNKLAPSAINCGSGIDVLASLAVGSSANCAATYSTTQADVDAGEITNTATATASPPGATTTEVRDSSTLTIPAVQSPSVTIVKSANTSSFRRPGRAIAYRYYVTNTGNVTLSNVRVIDNKLAPSAINCGSGIDVLASLAVGSSANCAATYSTTQADVDAGEITNIGTAVGTPPIGPNVSDASMVTVKAVQNPRISMAKSADITSYSAAGTLVTYKYAVTNVGDVTLTSVTVTDPMPGLSLVSCPGSTLGPATMEACSATYTTTLADVNTGSLSNTGTVTALSPESVGVRARSSLTIPTVRGQTTLPFVPQNHPAIQLNPGLGPPGTIVTVTGEGFPDNQHVTISWSTGTGSVVAATDGSGRIPPGSQMLVLTPDVLGPRVAQAVGYPASAPFLVVPNSAQPGGDSSNLIYRSEGP